MGKSLLHFLRHLFGLDAAHTQTTDAERSALVRHAKGCKRAVEIGVYEGSTTAILAQAMASDGVLHAVDPFWSGRMGICWGKWIARREIARAHVAARVEFMEMFSFEAAPLLQGDFDFMFIDGDHSVEGITRDWTDWAGRIAPQGLMALHDTRVPAHNPAVADLGSCKYFNTHIQHDERFQMLEQVDSLTILRRKSGAVA